MTIEQLMFEASKLAVTERAKYRPLQAPWLGNKGWVVQSISNPNDKTLVAGTEAECRQWVERRILEAVFAHIKENWFACNELRHAAMQGAVQVMAVLDAMAGKDREN